MSHESTVAAMAELLGVLDEESLACQLQEVTTGLGFDQFVLDVEINRPVMGRMQFKASGHPWAWQRVHAREGLLERLDTPTDDNLGVSFGMSLPAHEKAGIASKLSLNRGKPLPIDTAEARHLYNSARIFSACVHVVTVRTLVPALLERSDPRLSARERQCVTWAAHGKTSEEIGVQLHISEPTVVFHINKVVRKLGVRNRMHAVALSVALGWVT